MSLQVSLRYFAPLFITHYWGFASLHPRISLGVVHCLFFFSNDSTFVRLRLLADGQPHGPELGTTSVSFHPSRLDLFVWGPPRSRPFFFLSCCCSPSAHWVETLDLLFDGLDPSPFSPQDGHSHRRPRSSFSNDFGKDPIGLSPLSTEAWCPRRIVRSTALEFEWPYFPLGSDAPGVGLRIFFSLSPRGCVLCLRGPSLHYPSCMLSFEPLGSRAGGGCWWHCPSYF